MTVREAFKIAGYPIPDDAILWISCRTWWLGLRSQSCKPRLFDIDRGGWVEGGMGKIPEPKVDLCNLPFMDAYSALPRDIREFSFGKDNKNYVPHRR